MGYKLKWKREAEVEFDHLDTGLRKQAFTQFKKLAASPELGLPLGHKAGMDLTGYRKLYFEKYRIVYKLDAAKGEVMIFAIGKREDMTVYREVVRRLEAGA